MAPLSLTAWRSRDYMIYASDRDGAICSVVRCGPSPSGATRRMRRSAADKAYLAAIMVRPPELERLANLGEPRAQYDLAVLYDKGLGSRRVMLRRCGGIRVRPSKENHEPSTISGSCI
jgi:hypothetical protein